jgi:hypothetical protein
MSDPDGGPVAGVIIGAAKIWYGLVRILTGKKKEKAQ